MPNRITAMIMYVLACAIQFAHSAIPHDHTNLAHDHRQNHDHGHQHDHQHDDHGSRDHERSIFDIFSHFNHSAETFINYQQLSQSDCLSIVLDIPSGISIPAYSTYDSRPESVKPPDIFISPHLFSRLFRGPPAV